MILKNDIKYDEMTKTQVLESISNLRTSWTTILKFIEGVPSHWLKKPIRHIMKINVDFNNLVLLIEKSLKLRLKDIYFSLDIKELNDLIKRSKELEKNEISLLLELQDNETCFIKGEKEIKDGDGNVIKMSPSVINHAIKDIKEDINKNRKKIKEIEEEEKALALLLRKKYF